MTIKNAFYRLFYIVFLAIFCSATADANPPKATDGKQRAQDMQAPKPGPKLHWPHLKKAQPIKIEELKQRYKWIEQTLHLSSSPAQQSSADLRKYFPDGAMPPPHPFYTLEFQQNLDALTHSRLSAGNQLRLLPNKNSFVRKKELMHAAQKSLFVAVMVFHCDQGGKAYANELIAAKQRGVDVRLMIDGIMRWAAGSCIDKIKRAKIPVLVSTRSLIPSKIDWEMHDKLFVVDADQPNGAVAVVGGQNIGSWYFDSNGVDSNYRDTDIEVRGPVSRDIARRYLRIWQELNPQDASLEGYRARLRDLDLRDAAKKQLGRDNYSDWIDNFTSRAFFTRANSAKKSGPSKAEDAKTKNYIGQSVDQALCRFVWQDPHHQTFHVFDAYTRLAQNSRRHIVMHAIAFDPIGSPRQQTFLQALKDLSMKPGGRVDVITNGPGLVESKTMPAQLGFWFGAMSLNSAYQGIEGSKIHMWAYRSYVHSKVFLFDDAALAVGSFNYDDSAVRCQESALICMNPRLIEQAQQMFARDMSNATEVSLGKEQQLQNQQLRRQQLKIFRKLNKKRHQQD